MRYLWLSAPVAVVLVAITAKAVLADGFKLPNLNPFAKPKKPTYRLAGNGRMPQKKPSTWTKFSRGTKDFVNKTTDFLRQRWNRPPIISHWWSAQVLRLVASS